MPPYILESSNYNPRTSSQQQRPLGSDSSTSRDLRPHTLREVLYPNETLPSGSGQANKKRGGSSVQGDNPNKSRKRSSKTTAGMSQSTAYGPTTGFTQQQFSSGQLPPEFNSLWKILNDCRESNNQLIREFSEFCNQTDEKLTTTNGKLTAVLGMLKTLLDR